MFLTSKQTDCKTEAEKIADHFVALGYEIEIEFNSCPWQKAWIINVYSKNTRIARVFS